MPAVRVTALRQTRHRLPLDPPFHPTWDGRPREWFDLDLVRVETDAGITGIAAGDSMPGLAEHAALFVGHDPLDLERHREIVDNLSFHYGRCWPLEVALWDLAGKARGEPCWRMLGGASGQLHCYASSGKRRPPEAFAEVAHAAREAGFPALKLRFWHDDWREDVKGVEAARAAVGDRLALMVDCNQAWRMPWDVRAPWTLARALEVAAALADLDVRWMEEPLHRGDVEGLRALREASRVPVAGGEMTRELHELRDLIRRGALDVLQPDVVLTGGMAGLAEVAALARDHGVAFTPHTWGHGIGLLANAQLYAGVGGSPWLEYPFDPPEWAIARRDFGLVEPIALDDRGWLELGEAPGIGAVLDESTLERTLIER